MTPETRNGGPGQAAAAQQNAPHEHQQGIAIGDVVAAFGVRYLATGDAAYDWVVVRRCPLCGHGHRHVLFEGDADTIERAPACARHRTYVVEISDVVPAAAERRRGAA